MKPTNSPQEAFSRLPRRLFLDSSTLQVLETYGEFVYDGGSIDPSDRILTIPDGMLNLEALRQIMFVGQRAMFELVLSENSLREVLASGRPTYLNWALEVLDYWQGLLSGYAEGGVAPFTGRGGALAQSLMGQQFGYLSSKDRALLSDALVRECDAFITMDRKLQKNAPHLEQTTELRVLEPAQYWELLEPWAALFV